MTEHEPPSVSGPADALRARVAEAIARARGWGEHDIEVGRAHGTLPYDEARAALEVLESAQGVSTGDLSLRELYDISRALRAWQVNTGLKDRSDAEDVTPYLAKRLQDSRELDALRAKVAAWIATAKQRRTSEGDSSSA